MSEKKGFFATLFGGGHSSGCCNMEITEEPEQSAAPAAPAEGEAVIKVLGPGCRNCQALEKNLREALDSMGRQVVIEHVTDYSQIAAYGVMRTPGLVVNEKVVSSGKVPAAAELAKLLDGQV